MKNTPAEVLLYRKATGIGFASLFQDMCSSADIRCLTVDGFIKNNTEQIGEKDTEINHSWAVVQLGQSPETWYYVDPAWGSGYADAEMKVFTRPITQMLIFLQKKKLLTCSIIPIMRPGNWAVHQKIKKIFLKCRL